MSPRGVTVDVIPRPAEPHRDSQNGIERVTNNHSDQTKLFSKQKASSEQQNGLKLPSLDFVDEVYW